MPQDKLIEGRVDFPEGIEPFDPDRCPWCGDEGFDLRGLTHHVWMRCEVVERLADENIEDCRRSNQEFHEAMVRQHELARSQSTPDILRSDD